jgi:5'-3' exonuclease
MVGDSADGFPGLAGWGQRSAAAVLAHYGSIGNIPDRVSDWDPAVRRQVRGADKLAARLAADRPLAELFLDLATLRTDPPVIESAAALVWRGPTRRFAEVCDHFRDPALAKRVAALAPR